MKLIISNVSGIPIYEQIKQQIKAAILVLASFKPKKLCPPLEHLPKT